MTDRYDDANIFARIIRGEFPSHKVYEDDAAIAIMDVFPQARGHVLVIPKARSRNLLDADPVTLAPVIQLVQRVARAVQAVTGADGISVAQFNEAPAGQSVFHLHFHVVPAYEGTALGVHGQAKADDAELAALAAAIASQLVTPPSSS